MPSFSDSIVLFVLALLLFGPKKLPVLAREIGKWVGEFRRASNEFKMQMEEELRTTEQADRQAKIAAMEAAAPVPPVLTDGAAEPEPVQPNVTGTSYDFHEGETPTEAAEAPTEVAAETIQPLPIATSGDLSIMPPATGLPVPRKGTPFGALLDSIPVVEEHAATEHAATETTHG